MCVLNGQRHASRVRRSSSRYRRRPRTARRSATRSTRCVCSTVAPAITSRLTRRRALRFLRPAISRSGLSQPKASPRGWPCFRPTTGRFGLRTSTPAFATANYGGSALRTASCSPRALGLDSRPPRLGQGGRADRAEERRRRSLSACLRAAVRHPRAAGPTHRRGCATVARQCARTGSGSQRFPAVEWTKASDPANPHHCPQSSGGGGI
jgi:hypothetical protein